MSISIRKLGVLAAVAALLVVLAALRPTAQTPVAQADLAAPGGIAALPSSVPAIPGVMNQGIPAIIGTGQPAIIVVFCSAPTDTGQLLVGPCSDPITFTVTRAYPSGDPMATFKASGTSTLVVDDNSGGDMDSAVGVVAVELDAAAATLGGTKGVNEVLKVTATDSSLGGGCATCAGESRSVNVVVVDTMLAWGPTGQVSTASQEQPVFVSYHCDNLGRAPISDVSSNAGQDFAEGLPLGVPSEGQQGLEDMYNGLYGQHNPMTIVGPGDGWGSNTLAGDAEFNDVWCGGNSGSLFAGFVDFQTDKGQFGIDPIAIMVQQGSADAKILGNYFYPPILDPFCDAGKTIDTFDIDALAVWGAALTSPLGTSKGGCDLDGWRNGVVTTMLAGNGEVGVATITAQQGGGVSPVRTINVTFAGEAALSLFITAPASIGLTGGDFTVAVVDQNGVPVTNTTIQCTVAPAAGALALLAQTATTNGTTGEATFTLLPTGASVVAGAKITLTCVLDRDRSISATADVTLSTTPNLEPVALVMGCNPIAATWPKATPIATVAGAVAPATALEAIWKFDPATATWKGFSPSAPAAVNDLATVDRLDAIFICVNAAATVNRPVI